MAVTLKPCPHCGGTDLTDHLTYVMCNECLTAGPRIPVLADEYLLDYGASRLVWNELPREVLAK